MLRTIIPLVTLLIALLSSSIYAQDKRPLDHSDYGAWKSIGNTTLSADGSLTIYVLSPQEGDNEMAIRDNLSGEVQTISRASSPQLTAGNRHVLFDLEPLFTDTRKAKIEGKKGDDLPKDSLGILNIETGEIEKIGRVESYKFDEENGRWVAWLLEKKKDEKESEPDSAESLDSSFANRDLWMQTTRSRSNGNNKKSKASGTHLILRDLHNAGEIRFDDVELFEFNETGTMLSLTTTGNDSTGEASGVIVHNLQNGNSTRISSGADSYKGLVWSSMGDQLAFLAVNDTTESDLKYYSLFHWAEKQNTAGLLADTTTSGMPPNWMINEHAGPSFSEDGRRLYLGTVPVPAQKDTSVADIDIASVDIWNWKDGHLQSQQLINLKNEQSRTYRAVIHLRNNRFVQLADREMPSVALADRGDADFTLGTSDINHRLASSWEGFPVRNDVYLVDVRSGERRKIGEGMKQSITVSVGGNYFIWFDYEQGNWFTYDVRSGTIINLTEDVDVSFSNELHDSPSDPGPYGLMGWSVNDEAVYIYDRYDIWKFDPRGRNAPVSATNSRGRSEGITFRYVNLDREERYIHDREPVLLSSFHEKDKSNGLFSADIRRGNGPELLWNGPYSISTPVKAEDSKVYALTRGNFNTFPNLYLTDERFSNWEKITDANPQKEHFLWGDVELVSWISGDGVELEGLLYTPEDMDPETKYPMIVYFYERRSQSLYNFVTPAPSASTINLAYYVSNGYVVFIPDIVYTEGFPGESALKSIVSGTLSILDRGFTDPSRVGLQGQSWGGYQIAYLITRTNLYAAAMAGAPVSNMTSAYGGIRWASGLTRQFQYEQTQSRIGGSLWERPLYYIENSPLFFADKVKTPLLMMHNDADGAVPWYQGIEFFVALRRLNQPVWMLNYNDEAHNLRERVNRKDLSIRMQQFFDHYLKDAPPPVWMEYGVPAVDKGVNLGFELVE